MVTCRQSGFCYTNKASRMFSSTPAQKLFLITLSAILRTSCCHVFGAEVSAAFARRRRPSKRAFRLEEWKFCRRSPQAVHITVTYCGKLHVRRHYDCLVPAHIDECFADCGAGGNFCAAESAHCHRALLVYQSTRGRTSS